MARRRRAGRSGASNRTFIPRPDIDWRVPVAPRRRLSREVKRILANSVAIKPRAQRWFKDSWKGAPPVSEIRDYIQVRKRGLPRHSTLIHRAGYRPILVVPEWSRYAPFREGLGTLDRVLKERIGQFPANEVIICVKREQRRQAIFAAGAGGRRGRQRKHKPPSDVRC